MFHRQVHANNCLLRKSASSSFSLSLSPFLLAFTSTLSFLRLLLLYKPHATSASSHSSDSCTSASLPQTHSVTIITSSLITLSPSLTSSFSSFSLPVLQTFTIITASSLLFFLLLSPHCLFYILVLHYCLFPSHSFLQLINFLSLSVFLIYSLLFFYI